MKRKTVSGIMLTLFLTGMLTLAFNIQPVKASGTICIRADGSIDPPTANITTIDNVTYTFTDNNYDSIVVERDNIVVDGARYTLQGTGAYDSRGIDLTGRSNVTIKNMKIEKFGYGIRLENSSSNTISGNNITDNGRFGIYLTTSANNNITGNTITKCSFDIVLITSSNNILSGNNLTNNTIGVMLSGSSNNTLSGNMMNDNKYNFYVDGYELSHFMHSIDDSNLVNGKPVYYLVNQKGLVISSAAHPQVGYLALINCDNVTVEGLTLTDNVQGLLLAYTNNSRITDNTITNNMHGVCLGLSSSNSLSGNNITNNDSVGFYLVRSYNNTVSRNTIKNNAWGIELNMSSSNTVSGNKITNNYYGVHLDSSSNNKIYHNNFINNTRQVVLTSSGYTNSWDDGYPSGGNYWSDHNPPDIYSGPHQNETGRDRIGDTPYIINENNTDRYPLIYIWPDWDLNDDGKVNVKDIGIVAKAFGSKPGDPNWNPIADVYTDGKINIKDIGLIAIHFGETYP